MLHHYPQLGETQFQTVLPNGLRVLVVPKRGFSRKLAYFVTDFGSIHRDFLLEGKEYHAPAGVAHFLEHKLFELPGRDVSFSAVTVPEYWVKFAPSPLSKVTGPFFTRLTQ